MYVILWKMASFTKCIMAVKLRTRLIRSHDDYDLSALASLDDAVGGFVLQRRRL